MHTHTRHPYLPAKQGVCLFSAVFLKIKRSNVFFLFCVIQNGVVIRFCYSLEGSVPWWLTQAGRVCTSNISIFCSGAAPEKAPIRHFQSGLLTREGWSVADSWLLECC